MTLTTRLWILGLALAVNGAAIATAHVAMVKTTVRERLALQEPGRVVVSAQKAPGAVAASSCPGAKVL